MDIDWESRADRLLGQVQSQGRAIVMVTDELIEARRVAREYYSDIKKIVSDTQWGKHWKGDVMDFPWLEGGSDD